MNVSWGVQWFVVLGVITPGALLVLTFSSPSRRQMTRWATQAQVTITADNEAIRHRLGRARLFRSLTSLPLWWILILPLATQEPLPDWLEGAFWIPLTGYVLGSMLAAVTKPGEHDGVRTAALAPRLPSRYVPRRERIAPWLLLGVALVLFGAARTFPPEEALRLGSRLPLFVTAILVAALAEVALRVIANRPQVAGSDSRRSADDALRSTGATAAVASSIMLSLITVNAGIGSLGASGWRAWLGLPLLLTYGMTFGVFSSIVTQQPWAPAWLRQRRTESKLQSDPATKAIGATWN